MLTTACSLVVGFRLGL